MKDKADDQDRSRDWLLLLADRVVKRISIEFIYHGLLPNTLGWIHKKVKASNARELESENRQRKASSNSCFFFHVRAQKIGIDDSG